jgi:hypothetical protein
MSQEQLDEELTNCKADLKFHNGYGFGSTTRGVAGVLILLGVFAIISGGAGFFIGPVITLACIYALTSTYGTEISLSNQHVREYHTAFGIKSGKWVPTSTFPDIAVMRIGKSKGVVNYRTGGTALEVDASANEVYLLSANHRAKILLRTCKSKSEAEKFATEIAEKMNKKFVTFNPVISEKTKARR